MRLSAVPFRQMLALTFLMGCMLGMSIAIHAQNRVLFEDDFAHGTSLWPETLGTWTTVPGGVQTEERFASEIVGGHPQWHDIDLEVEFELIQPLSSNANVKLLLRWQGQWHGYGLLFDPSGARLVRFEGGARQYQVLAQSGYTLEPGQTYRVRTNLQGRRMTVYVNGSPIMQGMDPIQTHRAGQIGIRTESAAILLRAVQVTGSQDQPAFDTQWLATLSDLDRILSGFPSAESWDGPGYYPPGSDASGGARDIMLIYTHGTPWQLIDALPYVGYGELRREFGSLPTLEWHDWFFDTFLFLSLRTSDGLRDYGLGNGVTWDDWMDFLDQVFTEEMYIHAFEQATERVKQSLGESDYRANVILMIPYPHGGQTRFGDPLGTGRTLNFSANGQDEKAALQARIDAIGAYIDEALARWNTQDFEHLELIGFYWVAESLSSPGDEELVQKTAAWVHERGYKLFWIPHFAAVGVDAWAELGFDTVILQPNYMFNDRLPRNRLLDAAQRAYAHGLGIEIEADGTILSSESGRERYRDYLWAGVKYGYMDAAIHAYYQEVNLLGRAFLSTDPDIRAVYDDTYLFVKGQLGQEPLSP